MFSPSTRAARLRQRQALLRWRVYFGWPLLGLVVFGGPYSIITAFGWNWWSALACVALLAGMEPVLTRLLPAWTLSARQARGRWLLELAKTSALAPILLLRSFSSAVTVEPTPTITVFGRETPINDVNSPAAPRSHLLVMASEMRTHGPVVAIGSARRGIAAAPKLDLLMFEPDDDIWFEVFEILSAASRAVLMLPGETQSVGREYNSLKSRNLLPKLVLVMPPYSRTFRGRRAIMPFIDDKFAELEAGWSKAREHFKALGVMLPPYDPGGLAFTIDATGSVKDQVALAGSFLRIQRAVDRLVPADTVKVRPLGETMRLLEPFRLSRQ